MKPISTLDEAHKYLMYIADALWNVSSTFYIEKQDKVVLEKYANDLAEYAKGIEQVKRNMLARGEAKKREIEEEEQEEMRKKEMKEEKRKQDNSRS